MSDTPLSILGKYNDAYDGDIQGCCPLIADEIQKAVGGEVVAGFLFWNGGSCCRLHWWVVKDNKVIDPMGDDILRFEDYPGREEIHRDRNEFDAILPDYEQWRNTGSKP